MMHGALIMAFLVAAAADDPAAWRAGVARADITPGEPVVLLGYGDRTGPFTSVAQPIYAKALALEDPWGHRAVLITADLVGFQAAVTTDAVAARIHAETGLSRDQLLFNASHSHTGPLVSLDPWLDANAAAHPPLTPEDAAATARYTEGLRDKLVQVVVDALADLDAARLAWGRGDVPFPMNRRLPRDGRIVMADNPDGPMDRTVPVLQVAAPGGALRAVVFGCACHNTALTGADNVIAGDYAGFAQARLEAAYPGAAALFMSGCGGDANPSPRGSMDLARQHGETLAAAVDRVLAGPLTPVTGPLETRYTLAALPLLPPTRALIGAKAALPSAEAIMARHMLGMLDAGTALPTQYEAPFALWRIGDTLTLVALPAEPVAAYVGLVQAALDDDNAWVAGYNNDCFGYLPTAQVVKEGGHENIGITLWIWGQELRGNAGFFAPEVEQTVIETVRTLANSAGESPASAKGPK